MSACFVVGDSLRDQLPEGWRVIELPQVAEFVHDDIVGKVRRQVGNAKVETEIPLGRTGAPARLLVADKDALVRKAIELIEMLKARVRKRTRKLCYLSLRLTLRTHTR